jgi:glycerol-3-phosphate dehydrogenase
MAKKEIEWKKSEIDYTKLNELTHHQLVVSHISKVSKNSEWRQKISNSHANKVLSESTKTKLSKVVNEFNSSLSSKQRKEKYSNDSSSRKSLQIRKEILDSIDGDTFITSQLRTACEKYGLGNWKGLLKDNRLVIQIHKGTNQNNPSIYKKI